MLKKELIELLKDIDDEVDIDSTLSTSDFAKSLQASALTLDAFKNKITSDKDFSSFLDSEKDKHYSKALETWKTNNLQKLIDQEVKKRYPDKSEKDIELENLRREFEELKNAKVREELTNKALKIASEKKLPSDLITFFIGQDEESTIKNLESLETVFTKQLETVVTERLNGNSYVPPSGNGEITNSYESLMKNSDNMTAEQVAEQFSKLNK